MIGEFHFLRPLWLVALAPLVVLAWHWLRRPPTPDPWRRVIDAHLLEHLRVGGTGTGRLPGALLALGWIVAVLALAGPTWSRMPAAKFRPDAVPLVVVLDLSRSMKAVDAPPTRLAVAGALLDRFLVALKPREVGLVAFAGKAHAVMPPTEDRRLIRALLPHLDTNLMPATGSDPAAGLLRARDMLARTGASGGEILLVTDGDQGFDPAADAAGHLRDSAIRTSVLGIGTAAGGRVRTADGSALTVGGRTVVPRLDRAGLDRIAAAGGGALVVADAADAEIRSLVPEARLLGLGDGKQATEDTETRRRPWRDRGPWLVIPLLLLAALGFRRGWLGALLLAGALAGPHPAAAFDWAALWRTPDQQARDLLRGGRPGLAANRFEDPFWRGVAQFRDHDFAAAEATFAGLADDPARGAAAHYNRGNALVNLGRLEDAVAAYDAALARDPGLKAAAANRRLVAEELAKPPSSAPAPPPVPVPAPPAPEAADTAKPFVQERIDDTGGSRLEDLPGGIEEHGIEGRLGSGQILSDGTADAKGKEGPGVGQDSGEGGFADDGRNGARRAETRAGAVDPGRADREPGPAPAEGEETGTETPATGDTGSAPGRTGGETGSGRTDSRAAGRSEDDGRARTEAAPGAASTAPEETETSREDAPSTAPPPNGLAEDRQARAQWLARIPDDPGGLLRELFRRQAERTGRTAPEGRPW